MIPLCIYTVGIGIIRPGMSLVLMDCFPQSRGMASSVLSFIQTLLFALCSAVVVPMLYGSGWKYEAAIITFAVITILFWVMGGYLRLRRGGCHWK